ncbi:MAG: hypothetical protein AAGD10_10045 [Myxococcota bacterium]
MKNTALWPLMAALALCACGDDDNNGAGTGNGSGNDSSNGTGNGDANPLGQLCGDGLDACPSGSTCATPGLVGASDTQGYCTPVCASTPDCTTGYDGPGRASCFSAPECVISCDNPMAAGECPDGLTCLPTGGPTSACGVADTSGPVNALGQLCGDGLPECPADHTCATPPLVGASATQGYCTPICAGNPDCTDGYDGPGRPSCFTAPECVISCDNPMAAGECPDGLTCLPTGGPTSACGVEG